MRFQALILGVILGYYPQGQAWSNVRRMNAPIIGVLSHPLVHEADRKGLHPHIVTFYLPIGAHGCELQA
ncbi:hypothetical protein CEXT_115671 [Caerostris extrusa]|uniref:Uncharacterized protein n=1 Tax=Caerostris extrusa TaxID=172846 RepID=A0AAV4RUM3_CAEEX|nr:hypothetical protein CEXT_115671 [Caerostris extrusa]